MAKSEQPLVSVCMITYNHADFVSEAIESIVSQQTSFPFELIIADDVSSDDTRSICMGWKEKYPEIIHLVFHEKNLGISKNFFDTLLRARGKYVAVCEGDDYWIDCYKLQKQFDLLEQSNEYVLTYHNAIVNDGCKKHAFLDLNVDAHEVDLRELLEKWAIPTASVMYRRESFELPTDFPWFVNGDYSLELLLMIKGLFYYDTSIMSVYRKHGGSASDVLNTNQIKMYRGIISLLEYMRKLYPQSVGIHFEASINSYLDKIKQIEKDEKYPFLKYLNWRYYKRKIFKKFNIVRAS